MTAAETRAIQGALWLSADGIVRGFARDPNDPAARLVVEILADGLPVALIRAEEPVVTDGDGPAVDGYHGFSVRIDDDILARAERLVACLANRDVIVGSVGVGGADPLRWAKPEAIGQARWAGGLRISGHLARQQGAAPVPSVKALIDGVEVAHAACRSWIQLDHGRVAQAFDLHLPAVFADGRVRAVEMRTDSGAELPGSPCLVVAFPDPLSDWIDGWAEVESETIRARFADGVLPQSLPLEAVDDWLSRFPPPAVEVPVEARVAVVVVGDVDRHATLASLDTQTGSDWSAAALAGRGSRVAFDPHHLRTFLDEEAVDCPLVVMVLSGAVLAPGALALIAACAAQVPDAQAFYPDLLVKTAGGQLWPLAFPAFDPELFLETAYCGLVYAIRRDAALAALDQSGSLFDLFPAVEDGPVSAMPVHIPTPLATLPDTAFAGLRQGLVDATRGRLATWGCTAAVSESRVGALPSVVVRRSLPPDTVAALLPVRDTGPALDRTLEALASTGGRATLSIVIADNGSTDPGTLVTLEAAARRGHAVIRVPGWFCLPHLLNRAADAARADQLLFIEAGVTAPDAGWLDEMLGRCAGRGVGAVAPLMAWTTGIIRDAGFVLGPGHGVVPRFVDRSLHDEGHAGLLRAAHQCSALSASCLLTPRRLFQDFGGFDGGSFPLHLFAQDYCQRLRASGRRLILTPHARVEMAPDATTWPGSRPGPTADREAGLFRHRWSVAPGCDPFYSSWMAMDGRPYAGLAWPPIPFAPRQPLQPVARVLPAGF